MISRSKILYLFWMIYSITPNERDEISLFSTTFPTIEYHYSWRFAEAKTRHTFVFPRLYFRFAYVANPLIRVHHVGNGVLISCIPCCKEKRLQNSIESNPLF